ncbi:hypothetical protein NA57DRAFT_32586 [Rhizodiscina lignyota]|uniref:Amine oxidase n=1 Tax=Rhizodiscina lignyota TaxID=1504668 RepID=A0A9P4M984_9PEZI|nr:hypothetical protein NA57DRAFT_32586 [Rhizodiscina lignyota]
MKLELQCSITHYHLSFEVKKASQIILNDLRVKEEVKKLGLPDDAIIQCDSWMYGADRDSTPDTPKAIQALLYARAPHNHPESNQVVLICRGYAFPLPFSPLLDLYLQKVVEITPLATGGKEDGLAYHTGGSKPLDHCAENEYYHELIKETRTDLKPLQVVQPDGPSFKVEDDNCVSWQKWRFRVGFNYREGLVIHDVRYDKRPLFYRLSVSEMTVPYGDPRSPYNRKQAFDLGDAGAGSTANTLSLGCDCLGTIYYFSEWLNDEHGAPTRAENVICLHEQDGGLGWKHTNPRTGKAAVTRARSLLLQMVITVGNYEYAFVFCFNLNGNIELETRATGILSTALIDPGKTSDWGNVVSPGVLAPNHQHLFSFRIDPMIEGANNTIIQEDTEAVPQSEHENPHGNAFRIVKKPFERSGFADAAPLQNRVFKIVNEKKRNRVSQNPVGYKLVPQPCQLILATPGSVARRRARFAEHHIWVTKYRDGDLWAGGKWTNQSLIDKDGVVDAAARNEDVRDKDLVLWCTYGMTHNPRVEDFPVMPCEITTISLKPSDFFERNPAIDVPQSRQEDNKSVLVGSPMTGTAEVAGQMGSCHKPKL